MEVCLACHQAGRPAGNEYAWAVGYQPGKKLADYWHGFEPEPGKQTSEFWSNGTAHKNRVQGNTFYAQRHARQWHTVFQLPRFARLAATSR